jgi:hypothetical protein
MGGFNLETNPCEEEFIPGTITRLTLTVDGLKFLATHAPEMIPDLPALSEIKDKSKASNVSKAFACMQVVWFCMQCVERYLRKSPIILLEVVTMAHCLSALVIHCLWWKKPFEVVEPTTRIVSGEKMSAILSYMWMSSAVGYRQGGTGTICEEPEFESIRFCRQESLTKDDFILPPFSYLSDCYGSSSRNMFQFTL